MAAAQTKDRLHGTLDALILKTLSWGPRHGYAISRWLSDTSGDAIQVEEGSLYPALYRMERERWIEAEWGVSELGRKARFYKLTPKGRKQLARRDPEVRRVRRGGVSHSAPGLSDVLAPERGRPGGRGARLPPRDGDPRAGRAGAERAGGAGRGAAPLRRSDRGRRPLPPARPGARAQRAPGRVPVRAAAGRAARAAPPSPGSRVHGRGRAHPGARHRRQHRDLQRGERGAAPAPALPARRAAHRDLGHDGRRAADPALLSRPAGIPRSEPHLRRHRHHP